MIYLFLKALHVAAVLTWIGGMLATLLLLAAMPRLQSGLAASLHRWDRRVTAPAMGLAWILGLTMAIQAGWLGELWLIIKLGYVVALSGLHGVLAGHLRRQAGQDDVPPLVARRYLAPLTIAAVAVIAVLVVAKPF